MPSTSPTLPAAATGLVALAADAANTTLAGSQYARSVAALETGGHAVAWASQDALFVQRYDAHGVKTGTETRVGTAAPGGAVTALRDGSIVVAEASGAQVVVHRFDANGASAGDVIVAGAAAGENLAQPVVLALADGGLAVGWSASAAGADPSLHVQRFDARMNTAGARTDFIAAGAGDNQSLKLVATPTGFVAGTTHRWQGISYVRFHIGATDVGALFDANTGMPESNTALAPLADGRFVLSSIDASGGWMQVLDAGGHAAGAPTRIGPAPLAAYGLADGGWITVTNQLYGAPAAVQRFDAQGRTVGAPVELASAVSLPLSAAQVGSGVAFAWTFTGAQGDADVRTQRVDAR